MGLETGTYIGDLVITNPVGATDPKSQGDDHLRLIKSVLKETFPGLAGSAFRLQTKSSNYSLVATDNMTMLLCTAALTLTLPAASTLGNKHMFFTMVKGPSVSFVRSGSDTINGLTALSFSFNQSVVVFCDGTNAYHALALGGIGGSFTTGDLKSSIRTEANVEPGWIIAAGTIGDASSGATNRANADCEALFTMLYDGWADAQAAVSSGRGASAAADWAAHKTIAVPDLRGRVIAGKDNMLGSSANLLVTAVAGGTIGAVGGAETHALSIGELAAHAHVAQGATARTLAQITPGSFAFLNESAAPFNFPVALSGDFSTTSVGSGAAHSSTQATIAMNVFIKL